MSKNEYDVIIVGAGPAGSVLAYHLATHGLKVQILEKAHLPRYKTCGGGLTFKALDNLPFEISSIIEVEALGGIFSYAGQFDRKVDTTEPVAWLMMRDRFDYYLTQEAVSSGAFLHDGLAVKGFKDDGGMLIIDTPQGKYKSVILVGADGVNSIVSRAGGLLPNRKFGFGLEAELAVSPEVLREQGRYTTFDFGVIPGGYGWVFPKSDHLSVGVFHAKPGKAPGIRQYLDTFIARYDILRDNQILNLQGHPIPLGGKRNNLHKDRMLIVGDAANLADPWLGEGISYAIMSAQIAAKVIYKAFEDGSFDLSDYTNEVNKRIVRQFNYASLVGDLVYRLPRLGVSLVNRCEYIQDSVFDTMRGDISFKELFYRLVIGLPKIINQVSKT